MAVCRDRRTNAEPYLARVTYYYYLVMYTKARSALVLFAFACRIGRKLHANLEVGVSCS